MPRRSALYRPWLASGCPRRRIARRSSLWHRASLALYSHEADIETRSKSKRSLPARSAGQHLNTGQTSAPPQVGLVNSYLLCKLWLEALIIAHPEEALR